MRNNQHIPRRKVSKTLVAVLICVPGLMNLFIFRRVLEEQMMLGSQVKVDVAVLYFPDEHVGIQNEYIQNVEIENDEIQNDEIQNDEIENVTSAQKDSLIREAPEEPCALLFFGLIREFKSTVLPSIQKNIIESNPHCDLFLHTYNITIVPKNPRSKEDGESSIDVNEAYLLVENNNINDIHDHIVIESMESFHMKRAQDLNRTRQNFHSSWGGCCISHDNMIKQWNSIEGAWDLMRAYEKKMLSGMSSNSNDTTYYKHVGLFRTDVFFATPIKIGDVDAILPKITSSYGYNDRLFYGKYEYAKVWASKRFDFIPIFEDKYMIGLGETMQPIDGYHSEFLLKKLMTHYQVPVVKDDTICFMRIRSGPKILQNDCSEYEKYDSITKVQKYLPPNITLGVPNWKGKVETKTGL